MLDLVKRQWLGRSVAPVLAASDLLPLNFETCNELVDDAPFQKMVQAPASLSNVDAAGKDIVALFEEGRERLLIVGRPGSGKTVAVALGPVHQSRTRRPFDSDPCSISPCFMVAQTRIVVELDPARVATEISGSAPTGQAWLAGDQIVPLLDGLDELEEALRASCVDAINHYLEGHQTPIVICSREIEYVEIGRRFRFPSAFRVRPLSDDQVRDYLDAAGLDDAVLRKRLRTEKPLHERQHTADAPCADGRCKPISIVLL